MGWWKRAAVRVRVTTTCACARVGAAPRTWVAYLRITMQRPKPRSTDPRLRMMASSMSYLRGPEQTRHCADHREGSPRHSPRTPSNS